MCLLLPVARPFGWNWKKTMSSYEEVKSSVISKLRMKGIYPSSQIEESIDMLYNQLGVLDPNEIYQTLLLDYKTTHRMEPDFNIGTTVTPFNPFSSIQTSNSIRTRNLDRNSKLDSKLNLRSPPRPNPNPFKTVQNNSNHSSHFNPSVPFVNPTWKSTNPVGNANASAGVYDPFGFGQQSLFCTGTSDLNSKRTKLDDLRLRKSRIINSPLRKHDPIKKSNELVRNPVGSTSIVSDKSNVFEFQLWNPFTKKEIKKIDKKSELTKYHIMNVAKYFETNTDFINLMKVSKEYKDIVNFFRYNPISDPSLFINMKEQVFYNLDDERIYKKKGLDYTYKLNWKKIEKDSCSGLCDPLGGDSFDFERNFDSYFSIKPNPSGYNGRETITKYNNPFNRTEKYITIPRRFKYIGDHAFNGFSSKIYFENVIDLSEFAFERSNIISIIIPEGITKIPYGLCNDCKMLTCVIFPSSLIEIDDFAFRNTRIPSIYIPSDLTRIGNSSFEGCSELTRCIMRYECKLKELGYRAFSNVNLKTFIIPKELDYLNQLSIMDSNISLLVTYIDTLCDLPHSVYTSEEEYNSYLEKIKSEN